MVAYSRNSFRLVISAACLGVFVILAPLGTQAPAQTAARSPVPRPVRPVQHDRNRNDVSNGLENLWRMMKQGRHAGLSARDTLAVRAAFRDVVARASASTVQVRCSGEPVALGTIVGENGYILTKSSEVTSSVTCRLSDGSVYPARIINRDSATDLAMLRIAAKHLPPIVWDREDAIRRGRWVATVGLNDIPLTIGVVSSIAHRVRGGMLGIVPGEGQHGPLVQRVERGSGADKAGLLVGDTITQLDGIPVATPDALIANLTTMPPGRKVRVTVLRDSQTLNIVVKLGNPRRGDSKQAKLSEKLAGPLSKRRVAFAAVFEHDSVLKPSQCGGPLIDVDGRALGINIARASRVSSLALPADVVRNVIPKLMRESTATVSRESADSTLLKPVLPPGNGLRN